MKLSIQNLSKTFGNVKALNEINFSIESGAFVCFLGPSGCGKTTLLRMIAGLEPTESGRIELGGKNLAATPARKRNFGVVFQSYSLFPNMTAQRNVGYGLECRKWPKSEMKPRISKMLEMVGLSDQANKLPSEMSGGQQQRIALARALAPNPALLLLDEPLSALDAKVRETLRHEIRSVQQGLGITTIMVTHDQEEALAMADVIVVLNQGRVEQIGSPRELYTEPSTAFVADFIGRMNILHLDSDTQEPTLAGKPLQLESSDQVISKVGIRPELVQLVDTNASQEPNTFSGKVKSVVFLGNITRLEVTLEDQDKIVAIELHGHSVVPEVDEQISFVLPEKALRVLV